MLIALFGLLGCGSAPAPEPAERLSCADILALPADDDFASPSEGAVVTAIYYSGFDCD